MNVRDNIEAGLYQTKIPYDFVREPVNEDTMTVRQAREHTDSQSALVREHRKKRCEDEGRLTQIFRSDLETEYGVVGHPKADRLYAIAWDHGHAYGLEEVAVHYAELVELIK